MNNEPIISDDYLDWLFERQLCEWEAEMNNEFTSSPEEPLEQLSTTA